uniref:Ig-like domain-containing protein n=1 Tax=Tetraodon nigroviridis TaxID=99883 RepID=H3CIA8_TETNG
MVFQRMLIQGGVSADSSCKKVTYPERNICAFEGSSVKFSCVYESWRTTPSVHWARSKSGHFQKVYSWHNRVQINTGRKESTLKITDLRESDSAKYHCQQSSRSSTWTSRFPGTTLTVRDGPNSCSVSASPSAEVEEGSSVTLSCSSDANPAANYSWFKESRSLDQEQEGVYPLSSIRSEDRGMYRCRSENPFGESSCSVLLDVQYAPKSCSVSASPSAEVEEGSPVTLSCSSDANPAATYSWFKDGEESLKSSEQNFTITNVRAEDAGTYSCHVWNARGRLTSSLR